MVTVGSHGHGVNFTDKASGHVSGGGTLMYMTSTPLMCMTSTPLMYMTSLPTHSPPFVAEFVVKVLLERVTDS